MGVKKGRTKNNLNVTIDKKLLARFNDFCEENSINKSNLMEKLIKKFLEGKK